MSPNAENAEKIAQELLTVADILGKTIKTVDNMGRNNWQAVKDESTSYETIVLKGPDILVALKTMAMRIDRAALAKHE